MRVDPKFVMREHLKALEKYEAYKKECRAKGQEPLPFEAWERKAINEAWEKAFESVVLESGGMVVDLGHTKIGLLGRKKNSNEQ